MRYFSGWLLHFYLIMENDVVCLEQIQTVAVGAAIGQACLLLAAGMKGRRYMMPHSTGVLSCGPMEWNWFLHLDRGTS